MLLSHGILNFACLRVMAVDRQHATTKQHLQVHSTTEIYNISLMEAPH